MASLKADYEAQGAEVILADAGDYSQGTVYVSVHKGADAVTMMNATGYDVATIGNHEFDYGYAQLAENMKAAKFKVLCADVLGADGKTIFDANTIIEKGGVKIGFFGLETPEAQTKANPKLIEGLKFLAGKDGKELYACADAQVKAQGAGGRHRRLPRPTWASTRAPSPIPPMIWPRMWRASTSSSTATPTV